MARLTSRKTEDIYSDQNAHYTDAFGDRILFSVDSDAGDEGNYDRCTSERRDDGDESTGSLNRSEVKEV